MESLAPEAFFLPPFTTQMEFNWSAYTSPVLGLDVGTLDTAVVTAVVLPVNANLHDYYISVFEWICSTSFFVWMPSIEHMLDMQLYKP